MIDGMGRGWCFTFLALVCLVTMPMLLISLKWGPVWREERRVRMDKQAEAKERAEQTTISNEKVVYNHSIENMSPLSELGREKDQERVA